MVSGGNSNDLFRVAVVGAGPSGFYAAEALLRAADDIQVDMYEQLPVPYGLVRFGVAPDHPKLKQVTATFERIADMRNFRFIGNVEAGVDVSIEELQVHYHATIFACGASHAKSLGIPGEGLPGSHSAIEFVGWYNGHPSFQDVCFDLSHPTAVVLGQGNVALDIARILAKPSEQLEATDIAHHALASLTGSKVQNIVIVGRRGPAQAKFASKELREFLCIDQCSVAVRPADLKLNAASQTELADPSSVNSRANYSLFQTFSNNWDVKQPRRCEFQFLQSPTAIVGDGKVEGVELERNRLRGDAFKQYAQGYGYREIIECGLVIRCVGYRVATLPGLSVDEKRGLFRHRDGRLYSRGTNPPGYYATGWMKRGANGTIGSNRRDSMATVTALLADRPRLEEKALAEGDLLDRIRDRGTRIVDFADWRRIDSAERARGQYRGKPREKFTTVTEMLEAIDAA